MSDSEICDSEASDMPLMELDEYLEMIVVPKVIGLMRGVLGEVDRGRGGVPASDGFEELGERGGSPPLYGGQEAGVDELQG